MLCTGASPHRCGRAQTKVLSPCLFTHIKGNDSNVKSSAQVRTLGQSPSHPLKRRAGPPYGTGGWKGAQGVTFSKPPSQKKPQTTRPASDRAPWLPVSQTLPLMEVSQPGQLRPPPLAQEPGTMSDEPVGGGTISHHSHWLSSEPLLLTRGFRVDGHRFLGQIAPESRGQIAAAVLEHLHSHTLQPVASSMVFHGLHQWGSGLAQR